MLNKPFQSTAREREKLEAWITPHGSHDEFEDPYETDRRVALEVRGIGEVLNVFRPSTLNIDPWVALGLI